MRNTSWAKVQPGQIIYFTYKSKHDDVGYPRTVLVLNPKLRYKKKSTNRSKYYLVGLVLDTRISRGLTAGQLKKLFGRIGGDTGINVLQFMAHEAGQAELEGREAEYGQAAQEALVMGAAMSTIARTSQIMGLKNAIQFQ